MGRLGLISPENVNFPVEEVQGFKAELHRIDSRSPLKSAALKAAVDHSPCCTAASEKQTHTSHKALEKALKTVTLNVEDMLQSPEKTTGKEGALTFFVFN